MKLRFALYHQLLSLIGRFKMTAIVDEVSLLKPPVLNNITSFDRGFFVKEVNVPSLIISSKTFPSIAPVIKPYLLKLPKLNPVVYGNNFATVFLNPHKIKKWSDLDTIKDKLENVGVSKDDLKDKLVTLTYDNWNADEILRAILPSDSEIARSFSRVGHILHVNLKENLEPYKVIIGQILLDKIPNIKTIVNKTSGISNTYRNFQMEVIAGEDNMITSVKENGLTFELDFSLVYWNPRLSTEHQRIVDLLKPGDVLFDVFCGIGPFAVPCAKKGCKVYANDLNPHCYTWLNRNIKINKIKELNIRSYNKDGGQFIREDLKEIMLKLSKDVSFQGKVHVAMNLPAIALEFIKYFKNLFITEEIDVTSLKKIMPMIHVYFFVKGKELEKIALKDFAEITSISLIEGQYSYQYVRNVAPNKDMVKISFNPPNNFILDMIDGATPAKRHCS